MLGLLSVVDWANIGEQIKDFFIKWYNNELAFYLGLAGIVLVFLAILALVLAASYKKKKGGKKSKKAKKAKKELPVLEKTTSAPEPKRAPVAPAPAPVINEPAPVAVPAYTEPVYTEPVFTESTYTEPAYTQEPAYAETPAPVWDAPATEEVAEVDEEKVALPDFDDVPAEEVPAAMPYASFAPAEEEESEADKYNKEEHEVPDNDDSSWKSAKINLKRKTEKKAPVAEEATVENVAVEVAPAKKAPAKKPAVNKAPAKAEPEKVASSKKSSAAKAAPAKAAAEKKAPVAKSAPAADKPKVVGKYVISDNGGLYQFCLYANNGQLLYESREYASAASCKGGVETFKKNIPACDFRVDMDKNGGFKYIFKKGNSVYIGETYSTSKAAEKSAESVKRFVTISEIAE